MVNPKVTVIIPSYNPGKYLKEALVSVFKQTYTNWNLVIVDDHSTDNSLDTIKEYLKDPRVKLVRNNINLGQSKSLNKALNIIDTPYAMELDSDDWLTSDALDILVNEMENLPKEVALLTGNVIHVNEDSLGNQNHTFVKTIRTVGRSINEIDDILMTNYIPYPRFYRVSTLKELGGWPTYDPWEGRYVIDLFVFLRILEKYRFHWIDHTLYYYRLHGKNKTENKLPLGDALKWVYTDFIKRCYGQDYEPTFKVVDGGWTVIDKLNK